MKNIFKNTSGFTISEMLVTIFIISMMSGTFLANYHSANEKTALVMSAQKLVSDIRLAQNNTLGLAPFSDSIASSSWGMYFDIASPTQYIMFSDINDNKQYDPDESYKTYKLSPNVYIKYLKISKDSEIDVSSSSLIFFPPDPTIYINAESILNFSALIPRNLKIYLYDKTDNIRTVTVNFFGSIDAK